MVVKQDDQSAREGACKTLGARLRSMAMARHPGHFERVQTRISEGCLMRLVDSWLLAFLGAGVSSAILVGDPVIDPGTACLVYSNDFEEPVGGEWSIQRRSITPVGGRRFLGEFGNQAVTLRLEGLRKHQTLRLSFDLLVIRSWDGVTGAPIGPDIWGLELDAATIIRTTFSTTKGGQSYPGNYPGVEYPPRHEAKENNTLGYTFNFPGIGVRPVDSVYALEFEVQHSGETAAFQFYAQGLQGIEDESWGLDNVSVSLSSGPCLCDSLPGDEDTDGDGVADLTECQRGMDWNDPCDQFSFELDGNGDGLSDRDQCNLANDDRDSDGDSIPDYFERNGCYIITEVGETRYVDLPGLGADPTMKDVFVQIDYLVSEGDEEDPPHSHGPVAQGPMAGLLETGLDEVVEAFRREGIRLHYMFGNAIPETALNKTLGEFNGDVYITGSPPEESRPYFYDLKRAWFLRTHPERERFFHYCLLAHVLPESEGEVPACETPVKRCEMPAAGSGGPSGASLGAVCPRGAMDFIVALGSPVPIDSRRRPYERKLGGTFMHELGHNLGLGHGGVRNRTNQPCADAVVKNTTNGKPNHFSVMNYLYQYGIPTVDSDVFVLDYSSGEEETGILFEEDLDETVGVVATGHALIYLAVYFQNGVPLPTHVNVGVDWDGNRLLQSETAADISGNCCLDSEGYSTLNEWTNLVFDGGGGLAEFGLPLSSPTEIDFRDREDPAMEDLDALPNVGQVFGRGDANSSGDVDLSDAIFVLGCLFLGTECSSCPDASDVNDDGVLDISDPVSLLQWLFLGGAELPSPGVQCGGDPSGDTLPVCLYSVSGCGVK